MRVKYIIAVSLALLAGVAASVFASGASGAGTITIPGPVGHVVTTVLDSVTNILHPPTTTVHSTTTTTVPAHTVTRTSTVVHTTTVSRTTTVPAHTTTTSHGKKVPARAAGGAATPTSTTPAGSAALVGASTTTATIGGTSPTSPTSPTSTSGGAPAAAQNCDRQCISQRVKGLLPHSKLWQLFERIFLITALAVLLMAISVIFSSRRARLSKKMENRLRDDVGALQAALLPVVPPMVGALDASAAYKPASGPAAGGDFFEVFEVDGKTVAIIGDVAGHGLDALQQTVFVHYALKTWLKDGLTPREALARGSRTLSDDLGTGFVTALVSSFDPEAMTFTWASAGHPHPIFTGPATPVVPAVESSPPLGLGMPSGITETTVRLQPGTGICMYTDGLPEAPAKGGGRVGTELVVRAAENHLSAPAKRRARAIITQVLSASKGGADDMACVYLKVPADAPSHGDAEVVREERFVAGEEEISTVMSEATALGMSSQATEGMQESLRDSLPTLLQLFPSAQRYLLG